MSSTAEHNALVALVRQKHGHHERLRMFLNSKVKMIRGVPHATPGLGTGSSDIIGIWRPEGRFCAFECKTGDAVCTAAQSLFLDGVVEMGGFSCVFRSEEDFDRALEALARGESRYGEW